MSNIQTIGYLSGYVTSHAGVIFQKNPFIRFQDKKLFGFQPKIWNQISYLFAPNMHFLANSIGTIFFLLILCHTSGAKFHKKSLQRIPIYKTVLFTVQKICVKIYPFAPNTHFLVNLKLVLFFLLIILYYGDKFQKKP